MRFIRKDQHLVTGVSAALPLDYRPLEIERYEQAGRLLLDSYPYRAHELSGWHRPSPEEAPDRWAALSSASADLLAYAALWRVEGTKFRFDLIVDCAKRGNGLGSRLFEVVVDAARRRGAATLQARALDTAPESLNFLNRRRFAETMRMRLFELRPDTMELALLHELRQLVIPQVDIAAVSPAQTAVEEFWARLAVVHEAARDGWPDPDPGGPVVPATTGQLRSMLIPADGLPLAFFVASVGQELVAYSALLRRREAGCAQFASTAVRPDVRNRKIATALRARCVLAARDAGCTHVLSWSGNDSLIRINQRFGFRETQCEIRLVRRLG